VLGNEFVDIEPIIEGCRQQKRASQHQLYVLFYHYAMTIARRYTAQVETAEEVVNDAFFKVFTKIHLFVGDQPFRFWLRRIIINTSIDRLRSSLNAPAPDELQPWHDAETDTGIIEDLTREQILQLLDQLPPAYRAVFNLYVVDQYTHDEIAVLLGIQPGTSKSNLARARQHLKTILAQDFEFSKQP
jgi:RNA polymerase sigma-70 factor (ECF subfamily)